MNMAPRPREFPRRPARYNREAFQRHLQELNDDQLERLELIVREADRNGTDLDLIAVCEALHWLPDGDVAAPAA